MSNESLLMQIEDSREKLVVMPINQEFSEELSENVKYPLNVDGTLTLKNKLLMREGEHNGKTYLWEELKGGMETGEGAGLFYDHDDSVQNYAGNVKNLRADEGSKSLYGDILVTNKQSALDISLGAKWGISPTIDAEKVDRDGLTYALDPKFISFALVLRPAVRETMLNSEDTVERRSKIERMEKDEKKLEKLEEEVKEKAEENKKVESEKEELKAKVEKFELAEVERQSQELLEAGVKYGMLNEGDLEKLKELNDKGRSFVSELMARVAKTLKLDEDDSKKDSEGEDDDEEKLKAKAASEAAKVAPVNDKLGESQNRIKSELSEDSAASAKLSKNMFEFMQEQEKQ